ncbi:hypothetical protein ACS0TY_031962 [Phlomoides rotata]
MRMCIAFTGSAYVNYEYQDAGSLGIHEEVLLTYVRIVKSGGLRAKPLFSVKCNKSDIPISL